MRKKAVILIFILVLMVPKYVVAETDEIMTSTQERFNINGFLKESEEYTGDFFENIDLKDMFNEAVQGKINNQTIYKKIINTANLFDRAYLRCYYFTRINR